MSNTIILINYISGSNQYEFDFSIRNSNERLSLGYLKSSLKESNIEVKIIESNSLNKILEFSRKEKPILIGITLINLTLESYVFLSESIKHEIPDVKIIVGGHLVTNAPKEILVECSAFDIAVLGFGEDTFPKLCVAIIKNKPIENIDGIAYRKGSEIVITKPRLFNSNLDLIHFPDRTVLKEKLKGGENCAARIVTSRGCPYACAYCTTPAFLDKHNLLEGNRWVGRSPKNVVDEIQEIYCNLGINKFIFCDDEFVARAIEGTSRVIEIANEILRRKLKIKYWAMFRSDDFNNEDISKINLLQESGLWGVFLGIETGSKNQLSLYNKGIDLETNLRAIRLFKSIDILVEIGSITFHPEITPEELLEVNAFLKKAGESSLYWHYTSKLALFPGTSHLINYYRKKGLLKMDFSYRNIYSYNFQDEKMGILLETLEDSYNLFYRADSIVWSMRRLNTILKTMMKNLLPVPFTELDFITSELDQIDSQIGIVYFTTINTIINDSMFSNCNQISELLKDTSIIIENHIRKYKNLVESLLNNRAKYMNHIDSEYIDSFFLSSQWYWLSQKNTKI